MRRENCLKRGLPEIPGEAVGKEIAEFLEKMSEKYGTKISYDPESGRMTAK